MKKFKYVFCLILTLILGIGSVAAASIQIPSTIELTVGETKELVIQLEDLAIIGDITNSDSSVVAIPSNSFAYKTVGVGSTTEKMLLQGLKVGEAVLTFSSDDATIFSTEQPYTFTTTTVKVVVKEKADNQNTTTNNNNTEPTTDDKVKNPQTGVEDYVLPAVIVNIVLIGIYLLVKKNSSFKRI